MPYNIGPTAALLSFCITENIDGMTEQRIIPEAMDPKNVGIDEESFIDVFYFIDGNWNSTEHFTGANGARDNKYVGFFFNIIASYRPDDAILFQLDPVTRIVTLRSELDRETIDNHEFRVIATNLQNGPESVRDGSYLIVHVSVIRYFIDRFYTARHPVHSPPNQGVKGVLIVVLKLYDG